MENNALIKEMLNKTVNQMLEPSFVETFKKQKESIEILKNKISELSNSLDPSIFN